MRRRGPLLSIVGLVALGTGTALALTPPARSSAEIAGCIRDPGCHASYVVAHRANGFGLPEDSRAAVEAAVAAGVPVIEIDIRRSADGRLVVIHDPKLDRTTSITGKVRELTAAELSRAVLANGETVPTFEEIYAISRGKAVLDLRFHVDAIEQAATWIAQHGSFDDVIFFVISDEFAATAARMRRLYPAMIVMAKAQSRAEVERVIALFGRPPEILHPDAVDTGFDRELRVRGIKTFRNLLPRQLDGPEGLANEVSFFRREIDFLQTDEPAPLLQKLRRRDARLWAGN